MSEPTITLQLTQEQVEDIIDDLALGGFATTMNLFIAALPADMRAALVAKWEKEDAADDGPTWLCACGHYEESGSHCSHCGAQPPWGCDCSQCQDAEIDPDDEPWLAGLEHYP